MAVVLFPIIPGIVLDVEQEMRVPTWFCRKNCACAGSCPAAGLACWNMARCCNCCCKDCCCCCIVEASAWISWCPSPRDPRINNCWLTSWLTSAACELLLFCWLDVCCCCCWWLLVSWLLTPELGEEALPLVPLLLFLCDTSVTWKSDVKDLYIYIYIYLFTLYFTRCWWETRIGVFLCFGERREPGSLRKLR